MSYTRAREELLEYERMGHRAQLECPEELSEIDLHFKRGNFGYHEALVAMRQAGYEAFL